MSPIGDSPSDLGEAGEEQTRGCTYTITTENNTPQGRDTTVREVNTISQRTLPINSKSICQIVYKQTQNELSVTQPTNRQAKQNNGEGSLTCSTNKSILGMGKRPLFWG